MKKAQDKEMTILPNVELAKLDTAKRLGYIKLITILVLVVFSVYLIANLITVVSVGMQLVAIKSQLPYYTVTYENGYTTCQTNMPEYVRSCNNITQVMPSGQVSQ